MPTFQMQAGGKTFEVDAPDMETAAASLGEHTGETPSMMEGMSRAFARGAPIVGGLLNKADAALNAAVAPAIDPLLPDSYNKTKLPEKTFGERYNHALEIQEGKDKGFAQAHPIADAVAEIGGGIASTGAAAATTTGARLLGLTGRTLPQMVGRGVASGAAIGATDAAVRGENPVSAGGIGGLVSGAAPVAGRLINATVAQPVRNAIRGIINPTEEAERRVASAINRDITAGDRGLTPQQFSDARNAGQPANLMDLGGETTRALARSAANTSPEGRATLNRAIDARFESQSPRLAAWLQHTFNYPNAEATQEAIDHVSRTVNRGAYARANSRPAAQAMWDEGFEQIMQAPAVQEAARKATTTGANRAAMEGFTPVRRPFEFHDQESLTPRYTQRTDNQGRVIRPNLDFWDHVKRNLDDKINSLQRAGENSAARDAQQLRTALVSHLDDLVPEYAHARAGAARFFGAEDALEAGQNFVGASQRFGIPETRRALARMTPGERNLFQDGYVSRLVQTIEKTGDRRSVLNKIAESPAAREEMRIALGPQRSAEVEARLRIEGVMDLARPAVQGNSTTTRQLVELGLAGGVGGYESYTGDPQALLHAALVYGAARGHRVIDDRVSREVARLLASNNVTQLQRGIRIISRNQQMMGAIRNADAGLAAIAARGATPTGSRDVGAQ